MDREANEAALRKLYDARTSHDAEAVKDLIDELFTSSAVWQIPGRGDLSGEYHGKENIKWIFSKLDELSGDTLHFKVMDVMATERHGVVLGERSAERGGRTYSWREVVVFGFMPDGITEARVYPEDEQGVQWFWSE